MSTHHYLAVDLGAESGRVMLGTLAEGRVAFRLEDLHRFPNQVSSLQGNGHIHWDLAASRERDFRRHRKGRR